MHLCRLLVSSGKQAYCYRMSIGFICDVSFGLIHSYRACSWDLITNSFISSFGGSGSGTTQTRLECPVLNMAIWFKSPLFGSGFYGTDVMYNQLRLASKISNLAQTSTITYLPAAIGILGFWLLIACVYGFNKLAQSPLLEDRSIRCGDGLFERGTVHVFYSCVSITFFAPRAFE